MTADSVYEPLYEDDHRRCLQHCDMDRSRPVILYGELGSPQLSPFLRVDTGAYTVLRHFVKVSKGYLHVSERGQLQYECRSQNLER